jgi:hypothetical protein
MTTATAENPGAANVLCRYHVCHPADGLVGTARRLADALRLGDSWEARDTGYPPYQVEVYDSMARRGRPQVWARRPGGWECVRLRGD